MSRVSRVGLLNIFGLLLLLVFVSFIGYLGGRAHLIGQIRDSITSFLESDNKILPGYPLRISDDQSYFELNALLDARLEEQRQEASIWTSLLETDITEEQEQILEQLRLNYVDLLNPWPGPEANLKPKQEFQFSQEGISVYLIEIETHPGVKLTSVLLKPENITSPAPTLLLLHGYDGNFNSIVSDDDYHHGFGFQLAKKGFIVLAPYQVASTINNRSTLYTKALASGWALDAIELHQLTRVVDYLFSLSEVDNKHVGVYGISLGGQHALRLSAIDPRLSLTIISGYFADRFDWLLKRESPSASAKAGEEFMEIISPIDNVLFEPSMSFLFSDLNLIALIQPRFLGIESGVQDPRHESAAAEFEKVAELYHHVGYPERSAFLSFPGGHEVSVENVMPFLMRWVNTDQFE